MTAALLLGACETTGLGGLGGSGQSRAERLAEAGQYNEAAAEYIYLAASASDAEKDRFTLLAVENWLDAGDTQRARSAFADVARPANDGALAALWSTNSVALALYRGEADAALNILEPLSRRPLSQRDRLRVDALRADAWIQKQDPARAIEIMTQRETWLNTRTAIENNRNRLWQGLLISNPQVLREAAMGVQNPETKGWLSLAALAASTGQQGIAWGNGITRWRSTNRNHPAAGLLGDLQIPDAAELDYPRQIALLLPLSGRSTAAGKAVQNGFLGAYFATAGALDDRQTIRIYDVASEGGANAAYEMAVNDGAEFVVGPLLKSSVTELANDTLVPVPLLTLNYLDDDTLAPPGLYQFALAPEDEAASAARRALQDGYTRAVALVPGNNWGRRVLQSFATEFEGLGGTLLDYRNYTPDVQDFSNDIENLMSLTGSVQRYQRMRANIRGNLQFDPRRRQDAEFVFLAAASAPGRLLKSQLKFHYSGDLPAYSISSVNSMDGRSNADLNGVMFADAPWLIDPQAWIRYLPQTYAEYWPAERRLGRLHAMGFDAYSLVVALYASRGAEIAEIDGASGKLSIDQRGRIHRELAWAQFQNGEAVALPRAERLHGPFRDISDAGEIIMPDTADTPWDSKIPD